MSNTSGAHARYQFGEFTLDTRRAALLRGDDEIPIRPQSFEVLRHLLANHGRLVSKDELLEEVWRGRAVTDDSLTQCLIDVRRAIGDDDRTVVRTVPRRGYIFEAPVTMTGSEFAPDRTIKQFNVGKWRLIAAAGALAIAILTWVLVPELWQVEQAPIENSIAVLPFVDMSTSQNQQYLGDGIAEDILNALAQNPTLKVIARTSSFSFAEQSPDIAAIRDALNVEYVLTGSVRRTGEFLRISVELSETENSTLVWSQPMETQISNLVGVQQDIAETVQSKILPDVQAVVTDPPGKRFSAKDLMYLAQRLERQLYDRPEIDEAVLQDAIDLYRQAVVADPRSALARARLARVLLFASRVDEAAPIAHQALSFDANSSEVLETMGRLYWTQDLPEDAGAAWHRAIRLNPNNADALRSYAYWRYVRADEDEAVAYYRDALVLDPLSLSRYSDLGNFLGHEARIAEVEEIIEQIRQRFDSANSYRVIAHLLSLIGRTDESIAWTIRARNLEPDSPFHIDQLAEYYADIGDFDTWTELDRDKLGLLLKFRRYEEFIPKAEDAIFDNPNDVYLQYLLAFAYNVTGRSGDAAAYLDRLGVTGDWSNVRFMYDIEASLMIADATYGSGDTERAQEFATDWLKGSHTTSMNWWVNVYSACALSILDRDDEALDRLDLVRKSPRLPWKHLIQDMVCFKKFREESRYLALLEHVDERLAAMREKLPRTLVEFGVRPVTLPNPR